jgi:hypothetical protein
MHALHTWQIIQACVVSNGVRNVSQACYRLLIRSKPYVAPVRIGLPNLFSLLTEFFCPLLKAELGTNPPGSWLRHLGDRETLGCSKAFGRHWHYETFRQNIVLERILFLLSASFLCGLGSGKEFWRGSGFGGSSSGGSCSGSYLTI